MTVNAYDVSTDMCECIWFSATSLCKTLFHSQALCPSSAECSLSSEPSDVQMHKIHISSKDWECIGEDPFGNPIVDKHYDADLGETWYTNEEGNRYTEDMGDPCNWPDRD